jgi:O-antigen ligase
MRFEFWKTGWIIWKENFWLGVGTGDLQDSFNKKYEDLKSSLEKQWRYRAHNQFLSIAIAFGLFGLIYFISVIILSGITATKNKNFFYLIFLCVALLSMLTEDTLETQAGVTFFAFFNSLLLFGSIPEKNSKY